MYKINDSIKENFYVENIAPSKRGRVFSISDMNPGQSSKMFVEDAKVFDDNFAFLSNALAKLHTELHEPMYNVNYTKDVPLDFGGGFVDYVSYYVVDWKSIMNEFRNIFGNNGNVIPRVNAGMTQRKVNVYTFQLAFDLHFVELEKAKKIPLQKDLTQIYNEVIVATADLFNERVAYLGIQGSHGLFNNPNISAHIIDNSTATGPGFKGMTDEAVVAFFNGVFELYLAESNINGRVVPDTFLVPFFVGSDLSGRFSALYTSTLRQFIVSHNLGVDETGNKEIRISSRPHLDTLGTAEAGRIVAYKKDKSFVRMDIPYPMQHFITLPNVNNMCYTSAFVEQVSEIQMPYNDGADDSFGPITYWDFAK